MHLTIKHYLAGGGFVALAVALGVGAATLHRRIETPKTVEVTVPEDTPIHVTLDQAIASDENRPGDHFEATVSQPVVIGGRTVIPEGANAEGVVVDVHRSGRLKGRASLQLALESVEVDGQEYDVQTSSSRRAGGQAQETRLGLHRRRGRRRSADWRGRRRRRRRIDRRTCGRRSRNSVCLSDGKERRPPASGNAAYVSTCGAFDHTDEEFKPKLSQRACIAQISTRRAGGTCPKKRMRAPALFFEGAWGGSESNDRACFPVVFFFFTWTLVEVSSRTKRSAPSGVLAQRAVCNRQFRHRAF